ncbi:uncharacterized protein LOC104441023 isoform X1 [Eucalyptus grandis]|uniref:uncharacterized protein LOC104441023 isoform X1 n=1 Tax=Eucalyptus grandis TaxID=71139 RepID=UPI00192EB355|nr:uncharacterized protein LOC104441023 isoform X1 [Eucalyptus grandis]
MIPQQWGSPCGNHCTSKFSALTQIPWRVFCKKACDADGETWEECVEECNEMCYKDPVLKDRQWSAYIDRSPGAATYSEGGTLGSSHCPRPQPPSLGMQIAHKNFRWVVQECFHACVSGCGYKFGIPLEKVEQVRPNRPLKPPPPVQKVTEPSPQPSVPSEDIPGTSA